MKRIMILAAVALAAEGLGGCAHAPAPEPEIKIVETKVPVPVQCKAQVDVADSYSDAAAEFISDIYEQARLLLKGREERAADQAKLTGAVVGCGGTVK